MLIAGINGSPNKSGNTGTLIKQVLAGAESRNAETVMFHVDSMKIGGCAGCNACKPTQVCVKPDDMQQFYKEASVIDCLVIGTPVYFDHVSAQLKTFIDRFYAFTGPNLEKRYPGGKKAVICLTYGDSNETAYDSVIEWLKERLMIYFDIETVGVLKKASCPDYSITGNDKPLMEEAFRIGCELAV